ncbi:MAG: TlpA family protein disulfide reductase [Acidobacteriaceae bacterium]|nr:TlpA family protein disulfide reductase [Acidobacteriaceae bacterium]
MKRFVIALAAFSLFSVAALAADEEPARKAPEFSFTIPGQGEKLLSQYRGKVVALEFIFTTCPHCQAASRTMTKLQQDYGARGLQVLDVAVNPNADLLVENFAKDFQVGFPVGWSTAAKMTSFMGFSDGRFVVPQLALIDRDGTIRYQTPALEDERWDKLMKEDALRAHIEELLSSNGASTGHPHATATRAVSSKKGS